MSGQMKKNNMGGILVLLVFAIFMVSILMVLLTGADVVQSLNQRDQASYSRRTAVQYLSTRIRQADRDGAVSVRSFAGQDALVLSETIDGATYETLVYCFDGYLRELFSELGLEQEPEFGEKILPADRFSVSDEGGFLLVEIALDEDSVETLVLGLRSEGETVQ